MHRVFELCIPLCLFVHSCFFGSTKDFACFVLSTVIGFSTVLREFSPKPTAAVLVVTMGKSKKLLKTLLGSDSSSDDDRRKDRRGGRRNANVVDEVAPDGRNKCRIFTHTGSCMYSMACRFAHVDSSNRVLNPKNGVPGPVQNAGGAANVPPAAAPAVAGNVITAVAPKPVTQTLTEEMVAATAGKVLDAFGLYGTPQAVQVQLISNGYIVSLWLQRDEKGDLVFQPGALTVGNSAHLQTLATMLSPLSPGPDNKPIGQETAQRLASQMIEQLKGLGVKCIETRTPEEVVAAPQALNLGGGDDKQTDFLTKIGATLDKNNEALMKLVDKRIAPLEVAKTAAAGAGTEATGVASTVELERIKQEKELLTLRAERERVTAEAHLARQQQELENLKREAASQRSVMERQMQIEKERMAAESLKIQQHAEAELIRKQRETEAMRVDAERRALEQQNEFHRMRSELLDQHKRAESELATQKAALLAASSTTDAESQERRMALENAMRLERERLAQELEAERQKLAREKAEAEARILAAAEAAGQKELLLAKQQQDMEADLQRQRLELELKTSELERQKIAAEADFLNAKKALHPHASGAVPAASLPPSPPASTSLGLGAAPAAVPPPATTALLSTSTASATTATAAVTPTGLGKDTTMVSGSQTKRPLPRKGNIFGVQRSPRVVQEAALNDSGSAGTPERRVRLKKKQAKRQASPPTGGSFGQLAPLRPAGLWESSDEDAEDCNSELDEPGVDKLIRSAMKPVSRRALFTVDAAHDKAEGIVDLTPSEQMSSASLTLNPSANPLTLGASSGDGLRIKGPSAAESGPPNLLVDAANSGAGSLGLQLPEDPDPLNEERQAAIQRVRAQAQAHVDYPPVERVAVPEEEMKRKHALLIELSAKEQTLSQEKRVVGPSKQHAIDIHVPLRGIPLRYLGRAGALSDAFRVQVSHDNIEEWALEYSAEDLAAAQTELPDILEWYRFQQQGATKLASVLKSWGILWTSPFKKLPMVSILSLVLAKARRCRQKSFYHMDSDEAFSEDSRMAVYEDAPVN